MAIKIAINGFGRIGRNVLRAIAESNRNDIQVVAINDLGPVETNAHLLRFDSVHGRFPGEIKVTKGSIDYGAGPIIVTAIRDPHELPHKELEVDIALECTGLFTAREKAAAHSNWPTKPTSSISMAYATPKRNGNRCPGGRALSSPPCLTRIVSGRWEESPSSQGSEPGISAASMSGS